MTYDTIAHFESGIGNPRSSTVTAIRAALEEAGVEFITYGGRARLQRKHDLPSEGGAKSGMPESDPRR